MKFILQSTSNCGRLGIIKNIPRLKDFEIETPHVLLHTMGGTVPHLTHEVLQMVTNENLSLNIPIQCVIQIQEPMKLYKKTISDYIGMSEYLSYCSYINPFEEINASHYKNKVAFNSRSGRKIFSAASYMELIESFKPDMFLLLADGWTNAESSKKRVHKSFENSTKLFEDCMEIYNKSDSLKSSQVLGAVQGGSDIFLREKSSKLIGESPVFGVVVDGLLNTTDVMLDITISDIQPSVEASLKYIPKEKLRVIHGCWNPSVVLSLIELGIDVFDSSYLTHITDQYGALIFPNTEDILKKYRNKTTEEIVKEEERVNQTENLNGVSVEEPFQKKIKLAKSSKYFMSLSDPCYSTDFTPINSLCPCLTCRNHTRAYIHHLVSVKEMLGHVLLMIHNLHHYLVFFSTIRKLIKSDKFYEFKKDFQLWIDDVNDLSPAS